MMPPDMHEHEEYVVREEITQNNLIQDKGMHADLIHSIAIHNLNTSKFELDSVS